MYGFIFNKRINFLFIYCSLYLIIEIEYFLIYVIFMVVVNGYEVLFFQIGVQIFVLKWYCVVDLCLVGWMFFYGLGWSCFEKGYSCIFRIISNWVIDWIYGQYYNLCFMELSYDCFYYKWILVVFYCEFNCR